MLEKFKDLGCYFKNEDASTIHLINHRKKEIVEKVDDYIAKDMLELVLEYRIGGYQLTKSQTKKFNNKYRGVSPSKKIDFLADMLEKEKPISNALMIEFFNAYCEEREGVDSYDYSVEFAQTQEYKRVKTEYQERCKDIDFLGKINSYIDKELDHQIFTHIFKFFISPYESRLQVDARTLSKKLDAYIEIGINYMQEKETKTLLEKINKFNEVSKNGYNHYFDTSHTIIQKKYANFLQHDISKDIDYLQAENKNNVINESLQKIQRQENQYNKVELLPASIKNIVDNITKNYVLLNNSLENLSSEEKFKIKNLMEKRVPEVLNLYLKFDDQYKHEMRNKEGLTIEDLTIGSLQDIEKVFNNIALQKSERVLDNASALRRYTKNL